MKILYTALALASLANGIASAQQQPAPFETKMLTKGVYWVNGGGGNSGIVIGHKGVIVIDAKTTADGGKQLLAEVAKLTPLPVTAVILTHSDGDHVNGLAAFPDGLTIIAQENEKKEQETALKAGGRGAPPANRLPNKLIVKDKESFKVDGIPFQFYHWGPAHTSGDLIVYLPVQKIVFTGDIIATQRLDPIIHLEKNGSTEGWIKTTKAIIALNGKMYVPGHGDIQDKGAIQSRLDLVQAKHDKIKALIAEGKSLPEIKAAVGEPAPAATPGRGPAFGNMTDIMYAESKK
jgi:cyclase